MSRKSRVLIVVALGSFVAMIVPLQIIFFFFVLCAYVIYIAYNIVVCVADDVE